METHEDRMERLRRVRRRRRRFALGSLGLMVLGFGLFYWWQPWEYDFIEREPPRSNPPVDPESGRLFSKGTRVTVVVAHPDDPEFYIGGLLTKLGESGAIIDLVLCTDGDKAYYPFEDHERNSRIRRAEQQEAARRWKAAGVHFLSFPDGRLDGSSPRLIQSLRDLLNKLKPEYVLAFDSEWPPRRRHQDHRNAGVATAEALKGVPSVWWLCRFSTSAPNYVVDISDYWDEKKSLIAVHESQFYGERLARIEGMVYRSAERDGERVGKKLGEGLRCTRLAQ